jgi:hypothetical protein
MDVHGRTWVYMGVHGDADGLVLDHQGEADGMILDHDGDAEAMVLDP